jgi:hypothetical protein
MTSVPEVVRVSTIATGSPAPMLPEHAIFETNPRGASTSASTGVVGEELTGVEGALDALAVAWGVPAVATAAGPEVSKLEGALAPQPANIRQQASKLAAVLCRGKPWARSPRMSL